MTRHAAARAFALALLFFPVVTLAQESQPSSASPPTPIVLGADQETPVHLFQTLPTGGFIELRRAADDSAGMRSVRTHLRGIARAFAAGDFGVSSSSHMTSAPGARVMADRRDVIRYDYRDLPRGGALRISTSDAVARRAIWDFIAYERSEHSANERQGMGPQ